MEQQQTRYFGLDVIRTFASIAVIAGHFFVLHTPFYDAIFEGYSMTIQSMAVFLFNACGVPLYLLITGYLNGKKEFNFKLLKNGGGY